MTQDEIMQKRLKNTAASDSICITTGDLQPPPLLVPACKTSAE